MRAAPFVVLLLLGGGIAVAGCDGPPPPVELGGGPDAGEVLGQGEDCSTGLPCAEGLVCASDGTCQPEGSDGTTPEDGPCLSTAYCAFGLVCAADGTCQEDGDPGTGEAGDECEEDADCAFGLECLDGACYGVQIPYWPGAACPEDPDAWPDQFVALFDAARATGDFYSLPFPNDIRRGGGHLDLSGHPSPGVIVEELGDPVGDYFDVLQQDLDGFGTNECVFFRFSRPVGEGALANMENVFIVDITPASPRYGEMAWSGFSADKARGRYICWNWLAICPSTGNPLLPGTTYAAVVLDSVVDDEGAPLGRDDAFAQMLGTAPPVDPALADAYAAYAPLRAYLADDAVEKPAPAEDVAVASVFTTQSSIDEVIPAVRAAVRAEAPPLVEGLETDATGDDFVLYTGTVTVPFYQAGTRPFRLPEDGGGIEYDADGAPLWVEDEAVRFALSVPLGGAPVDGWPVMIFAHGTGGSERSFVDDGMAARMAALGVAVIGVEQVAHGDRRGLGAAEADLEANAPGRLFYNFRNPRAARDNNVQAAADHFQVVRLIEEFAAISGAAVAFDADSILFFGHSQGSQGPMLFAAHEPAVAAVVLSGAGGSLIDSLLDKTNPVNVSAAVKVVLADPTVSKKHPLLNLIGAAYDVVDPLCHSAAVSRADWGPYGWPVAEVDYPHRHVFMSYGVGDTFTPESTQFALARGLRLWQWPLDPADPLPVIEVIESLPHAGTFSWEGDDITAVLVQYAPAGDYDAHFVMFEHPDAIAQLDSFVATYLADGVPSLLAP